MFKLALLLLALTGAELNAPKKRGIENGFLPFRSMAKGRQELLRAKSNLLKRKRNDAKNVYPNPFQQTRNEKQESPATRSKTTKRQDITNVHHIQSLGLKKQKLNTNKSHPVRRNLPNPTEHNMTANNSQTQGHNKDFITYMNTKSEQEQYENYLRELRQRSNVQLSFKEYMRKFDLSRIMEKIRPETSNITEQFMLAADMIDPTDELLKLKIEPINPNPFNINVNRRSWSPPTILGPRNHLDQYFLRPRIYFLIQQSLYQARDNLIHMQEMRAKYRSNQVYRMGYLTARLDHVAQLFAAVAYKLHWGCFLQSYYYNYWLRWEGWNREYVRFILYEHYDGEERLLNHWFESSLLLELITANHFTVMEVIKEYNKTGSKKWFTD